MGGESVGFSGSRPLVLVVVVVFVDAVDADVVGAASGAGVCDRGYGIAVSYLLFQYWI